MQIERACADIEVLDLKTAYLGRSHSLLICPPNEYVTAISGGHLIQCGGPNGLRERLTLGASGTPSVAGNATLLGTYAENGQCNRHGRRTALYSVQPAYACIGSRLRHRSDPQYDCS